MDKMNLIWVRRDLRLSDHTAIEEASKRGGECAVVFVFDSQILEKLDDKVDRRLQFIHSSIEEMDQSLRKKGSRLLVLHGDPVVEIPKLAKELNALSVVTSEDYESYAKGRDEKVARALEEINCQFVRVKDHVIFNGHEVLKSDGTPYQVFTPYKKAWLRQFKPEMVRDKTVPKIKWAPESLLGEKHELQSIEKYGFKKCELLVPAGEAEGKKLLQSFRKKLMVYDRDRDFPAVRGTSKLSVHFRFGTVSVREALRFCLSEKGKGPEVWMSELIWREFYFMILDQFPHVETQSFKPQYQSIKWPGLKEHFQKWCDGQTGFPIVDAGMRQLDETGFMHNRLRMIVASFLVKDLLIDWRWGEAYFAKKLLDFDLAANNGGWQWSASTGCDSQPYFRIFNPESQQKNFDPDGSFVKQWIPELGTKKYPDPIVDHNVQRNKALQLFKSV